jgi:hypothetical protein
MDVGCQPLDESDGMATSPEPQRFSGCKGAAVRLEKRRPVRNFKLRRLVGASDERIEGFLVVWIQAIPVHRVQKARHSRCHVD